LSIVIYFKNLQMKENKKVFVSSASDRGIMVKFLKKGRVSLSFWGNDEPKNISYSETEAKELCEYILLGLSEKTYNKETEDVKEMFKIAFQEIKRRTPPKSNI